MAVPGREAQERGEAVSENLRSLPGLETLLNGGPLAIVPKPKAVTPKNKFNSFSKIYSIMHDVLRA